MLIGIGKVNFESADIEANLKAILEELRVFGKTNNLKGKLKETKRESEAVYSISCYFVAFVQNVVLSSTRGPGVVISGGPTL